MGWTTPKGSKRRRTISGKRLFSILTCCSFTTAEKSSRQDSHLNDTLARRTNSNQATPSQTITCSTTSLASKEIHTQSNATASTTQKPSLEQQRPIVTKRDTAYMDTALDPQKEDLVGTMDQKTSSSFDVQVTTTPSLDVEQVLIYTTPFLSLLPHSFASLLSSPLYVPEDRLLKLTFAFSIQCNDDLT
jgi:hypothetical protein